MTPTHGLRKERVYTTVNGPHGPVRLLAGYVGVCECGARSPLYGIAEPIRLWHRQHLDPTGKKARATQGGIR